MKISINSSKTNIHIRAQKKAKIKRKEKHLALKIIILVIKKYQLTQKCKAFPMCKKKLINNKIYNFNIFKKITKIKNKITKKIRFLNLKIVRKINKKIPFKKTHK